MTENDEGEEIPIDIEPHDSESTPGRFEFETERAVNELERGIVDVLAWLLDTETRSRIYIYLRKYPDSTSEEIAEGTGLYPSTVREALAELTEEGTVTREKRESGGAGNNPYEYRAIPSNELIGDVIGQLQEQLNAVLSLDEQLGEEPRADDDDPITIRVDQELEDEDGPADDDVDMGADADEDEERKS